MNTEYLLNQLEELAGRLGIGIRYENVNVEESSLAGGFCRIKEKYVLIIQPRATINEKVRIITEALKTFPLGDIYVKPALRELIEAVSDDHDPLVVLPDR
ncbi:MAG: hypothetical protein V2B13_01775 [Pseudomonadota bacterium]